MWAKAVQKKKEETKEKNKEHESPYPLALQKSCKKTFRNEEKAQKTKKTKGL